MSLTVRAHDVFCLYATPRGHVAALRGLTLDVAEAERVVVHGPNGSGKTTLMRVLIGELAPSAGTVSVCGTDLAGASEGARTRLRSVHIGLIDQHHGRGLRPELTVRDNVALQLRLSGTRARSARRRAEELLDGLGLGALAGRRPATLSGGEAQRVCVCAAVTHRPTLILADEPTGELDPTSADEVYDLLAAVSGRSGAALVVVSHDGRAARIADRIVRIRDGRLSEEWTPTDPGESLVVDDRGWVRLPEPMRHRASIGARVRISTTASSVVLTSPSPVAMAHGPVAPPSRTWASQSSVRDVASVQHTASAWDTASVRDIASVRGVVVRRGGRPVLDEVDLTLPAGTLTVVQGRSGSGKTTLLRVLCGLERPDAGTVEVGGVDLAALDRAGLAALRRTRIAVAGQGTALVETMDIDENLDLIRLARALPADVARTGAWVRALGLEAVRHRPVRVLSGGERQRVSVARVLAAQPPLAVLDEPTSRQDEAHAELVVAALVTAAREGAAVVAATHDPVLVEVADAVLAL
jgi:ABC-type lipoprotein export system ATPase subunit